MHIGPEQEVILSDFQSTSAQGFGSPVQQNLPSVPQPPPLEGARIYKAAQLYKRMCLYVYRPRTLV